MSVTEAAATVKSRGRGSFGSRKWILEEGSPLASLLAETLRFRGPTAGSFAGSWLQSPGFYTCLQAGRPLQRRPLSLPQPNAEMRAG